MKIPFNIKYRPQIESGEYKVETKDGKPVRIICWDKKSEKKYGYHIVGLIEYGPQHEESTYYTIDGKGRLKDKDPDLYIITPEPELTEFEKAVKNMLSPYVKMPDEIHKEKAAKLLELARIQLIEEQLTSDPRKTDLYKLGKEEALKDLPRWKKATGKERFNERMIVLAGDNDLLCTNYAEKGEYYISFSELEKLPKEG